MNQQNCLVRSASPRTLLIRVCVPIATLLLVGLNPPVSAGVLRDLRALAFGIHGSSGKLAKYEFTLPEKSFVTSLAWSPNGRYIAETGTETSAIHIWDVNRRVVARRIAPPVAGPDPYVHVLSWSVDGRYLAGCDRWVVIYASNTWKPVHTFQTNPGGCQTAVFSSDNQQIAVLSNSVLTTYAMGTWKPLKSVDLWHGWARGHVFMAIAYVPGTHTLALGGYDFEGVTGK